jgi:hypothetical protein
MRDCDKGKGSVIMRKLRGRIAAGGFALALLASGAVGASGVAQAQVIPTYTCGAIQFRPSFGFFFLGIRGLGCVRNAPPLGQAGPGFVIAPFRSGPRRWFCTHVVVNPDFAVPAYVILASGCRNG